MLRIRLQRFGTKNEPSFRMVVAESTTRRDGRFVELLGHYNPRARGKATEFTLDAAKYDAWVKKGAQPSDTAKALIKRVKAAAKA